MHDNLYEKAIKNCYEKWNRRANECKVTLGYGIVENALALLKTQEVSTSESISSAIECLLHPQDADDSDMAKAINTAVRAMRLLKAQEPRIVTEADFKNADEAGYIPAWCEEKDTDEVYCECILIGALEDAKLGHMRWWTSRPTDEQREATPWPD